MILAKHVFKTLPENWCFCKYFKLEEPVYRWVAIINAALIDFFKTCNNSERINSCIPDHLTLKGDVYIGKNVNMTDFGTIEGPAYIGDGCILRPGVYIRGNVIVSNNCLLGNSCEFKNSLLLDNATVPHFNYVGDSILGNYVHLGAGSILSNLRFDKKCVKITDINGEKLQTNLKKLGSILGDYVEIGCNAVLQPGSCLFPNMKVFPCESFNGTLCNKIAEKY